MCSKNSVMYLRLLGYFQTHLCATAKEAAREFGISDSMARRYAALIRKDWNSPEPDVNDLAAMEQRLRFLELQIGRLMEKDS